MLRGAFGLLMITALLGVSSAGASVEDLRLAVADLTTQARDKQRMDRHKVATVEISQVHRWLRDATNAVKEEDEDRCRRVLRRVRAQLTLAEQLILLSNLTASAKKVERELAGLTASIKRSHKMLDEKQAQLAAMKRMQ